MKTKWSVEPRADSKPTTTSAPVPNTRRLERVSTLRKQLPKTRGEHYVTGLVRLPSGDLWAISFTTRKTREDQVDGVAQVDDWFLNTRRIRTLFGLLLICMELFAWRRPPIRNLSWVQATNNASKLFSFCLYERFVFIRFVDAQLTIINDAQLSKTRNNQFEALSKPGWMMCARLEQVSSVGLTLGTRAVRLLLAWLK